MNAIKELSASERARVSDWAEKNENHPIAIWFHLVIARIEGCDDAFNALIEIAPRRCKEIDRMTFDQVEDAFNCRAILGRIILNAIKGGKL